MADDEKHAHQKGGTETVVHDKSQGAEYDSESQSGIQNQDGTGKLKRQLKNRHIAMIRCVIRASCAVRQSSLGVLVVSVVCASA